MGETLPRSVILLIVVHWAIVEEPLAAGASFKLYQNYAFELPWVGMERLNTEELMCCVNARFWY